MATAEKLMEQVEAAQAEIRQKENLLRELKQKQKVQADKERTHRLIERGAILESLIENAVTYTNEQIKSFLEKTVTTEYARKILTQLKVQRIVESVAEQQVQPSENGGDTGEKSEIGLTEEG